MINTESRAATHPRRKAYLSTGILIWCLLVAAASGIAWAQTIEQEDKLPIILEGGILKKDDAVKDIKGEPALSRDVVLPTKGVWYLWLKATHNSKRLPGQGGDAPAPILIKYNLDGKQPLSTTTLHASI